MYSLKKLVQKWNGLVDDLKFSEVLGSFYVKKEILYTGMPSRYTILEMPVLVLIAYRISRSLAKWTNMVLRGNLPK